MSTDHGFRLPLAARIFLASAVLVAIAVAMAAFFTLKQGRRAGAEAVEPVSYTHLTLPTSDLV